MNKAEENRLSDLARTAKDLRACIDAADSMMRSWAKHKPEAGEIYLSMSDRRVSRWHTGVHLPAEVVQADLVPVLKHIRDEAAKQLRDLAPEINP